MAGKSSDTAVSVIFEQVAKVNSQAQFKNDYKLWPTEQIKEYIPLTFLCCKDQITEKQRDELAMLMQTDKLLTSDYPSSIINYGRVTEDIAEALASVEQNDNSKIILINGAPGIGKSTLLNEIALQWSNKKILLNFKVLLSVSLCNPALCQLKSIKELFEHCCGNDSASIQDIDHCVKYFQQNDGKDLLFTFDGYDELHENLHKDGLICHILNRLELPQCGVIVSSRPHASINFVCETIDILGVSKKHRKGFFKKALSNESQTVSVELLKYLECHSFIYSLCYMPFNIDALVYFAKKLPHSPYHLYENLICLTVSKHIAKHGHEINDGGKITNLREPGKSTVQQLAKLSLNAFSENQYIFKLEDIKQYCPNITSIPGAINGFGLLQAEKHFTGTGMTLTFYFMNYSMQEFLAAYSLTLLSQSDELSFIANKFYDNQFCNVFSIYISLTLGQRPAFKDFFKEHIGRLVRKLSADSKIRNALYKTLHDDCFEDWPLHIKVLIPRIPNEKSRNDTITNDDFDADLRTIIQQWEGSWKVLGIVLDLSNYEISTISKDFALPLCPEQMLRKWMQIEQFPTWGKLEDAIKLTMILLTYVDGSEIRKTYDLNTQYNKKTISASDDMLHEVPKYNILLVVENHMQFKIAICHMEEAEITKVVIKSRPYFLGTWGQVPVILVQMMESEGENESENFTKKALSSMPHIKYVFAIGVCGTFVDNNDYEIVPRVNLCEVVISSHVINQDDSEDLTKSELFKFLKRPEYSEIDTKFGKIFSTSSPVADSDAVQKLLDKDPEGIAIEMDGVGIAIACKNSNSKVECLVVKGASDFFKRDTLFPVGAGRNAVRYLSRMLNKMLAGKFVEASSPPKNTRWIGNIENASFTHIGGVFHSDHCDVKITIPDGTIIPGFVVELKFAAAHYAPVKFAADELPLSPVVWLSMNGELKKPIEIHMPHYALIQEASQADNIHFAKSSHITNDESEVILTKIQGGKFPVGESYGIIEIKHFCWFSIMKKIDPDKISKDIVMVVVHHKIPKNDIWKCYIGIMSNEEALFEAFKHQFDDDDHNDNNFDNDRPEIIKPLLPIKLVTKENQFNGEANIKHLSNKLQEITKSDADMRGQLENLGERLRGKTYPPCFRLSVHAKQPFFHYNHFFKFCLASTDDQKIIEKDIIIHKAVPIHSPTEFDEEPTLDEFDMIVTNITKDLNWELFAKRLLPINDKDLEELKKSQGYKNGCCNQVFTKWYVTTTTSVRSWHTIIQALKLSGDSKLLGTVETIENIINGTMVKINMKNDGKMIEDGDICTINESQNTKFKCKFIGLQKNIQYTWKHCAEGSDNFTDIEPDDSIKFEKKKAKFLIESLQLTHKGRYQCIATNCHKHTATFHFTLCVKESTTQSAMNNSHGTSPAHAGTDSDEGTSTSTDRSGDGENNYCIVQLDT